jgi:hypothetical protein
VRDPISKGTVMHTCWSLIGIDGHERTAPLLTFDVPKFYEYPTGNDRRTKRRHDWFHAIQAELRVLRTLPFGCNVSKTE